MSYNEMARSLAGAICFLFSAISGFSQLPPVGTIDVYGLRTVRESAIRNALPFKIGDDALPVVESAEKTRQQLRAIPGVEDASLNLVCCDDKNGKSIVFVGIRETGRSALSFRRPPTGRYALPGEIISAGKAFQSAFMKAAAERDFSEDDSQGHALFSNPGVRKVQEQFISLASGHFTDLKNVIRRSANAEQRALAAQVIAYYPDKKKVVPELLYAMNDPDEDTRNNAMRSLLVIAKYAKLHPDLRLHVPTIGFVRMLNSLVWTDRNKSAGALEVLTADREPHLLAEIKREALDSLSEMALWTNPGHAEPSFRILSRIAGLTEAEIDKAWSRTDSREETVREIIGRIRAGE